MLGKEVNVSIIKTGTQAEIDLSNMKQGIYFLSLQNESAQETIRVIKE